MGGEKNFDLGGENPQVPPAFKEGDLLLWGRDGESVPVVYVRAYENAFEILDDESSVWHHVRIQDGSAGGRYTVVPPDELRPATAQDLLVLEWGSE